MPLNPTDNGHLPVTSEILPSVKDVPLQDGEPFLSWTQRFAGNRHDVSLNYYSLTVIGSEERYTQLTLLISHRCKGRTAGGLRLARRNDQTVASHCASGGSITATWQICYFGCLGSLELNFPSASQCWAHRDTRATRAASSTHTRYSHLQFVATEPGRDAGWACFSGPLAELFGIDV